MQYNSEDLVVTVLAKAFEDYNASTKPDRFMPEPIADARTAFGFI
ncbi:MAG: hypothetical protein ACI32C_00140 [Candidatus Enteromonas sp.]